MTKHILTKLQRNMHGLYTVEDDHVLTVYNREHEVVARFSARGATIAEIQRAADDYLESPRALLNESRR